MPRPEETQVLQAVLVVDDFENHLQPITLSRSKGLVPVVNKPLVDFSLSLLETSGVQEVFVFCSAFHQDVAKHIKDTWSQSVMDVHVLVSETYTSLGDVLRDVDGKGRIKSDFILIRGDIVASFNMKTLLEAHKSHRAMDKNCVMTLGFTDCKDDSETIVARNRSDKILYFSKGDKRTTARLPLRLFKENTMVRITKHLRDTHIAVCSQNVLLLFTDNVDYQTSSDFIRGTLDNEDILGNTLYLHLIDGFCSRVIDPRTYHEVSRAILSRWSHPFVPDKMDGLTFNQNNIFIDKGCREIKLRDCSLDRDILVGSSSVFGKNVSISQSVIGNNCKIGNNIKLHQAYIFDGVTIEDNCTVSHCIIGDGVVLRKGACVLKGCVLASKVVIGAGSVIESSGVREVAPSEHSDPRLKGDGSGFLIPFDVSPVDSWPVPEISGEEISSMLSGSDSDKEDMEFTGEDESVSAFFSEVVDNFKRGIIENIACDNLILEVNSMKHAYNIPINEVNTLVIQAAVEVASTIQDLQGKTTAPQVFQKLLPLIKNYIRDESSQLDCILALEEFLLHHKEAFSTPLFVKILKFLYDSDVLDEEVICLWFSGENDLSSLVFHEEIPDNHRKSLRKEPLLRQFIQWLQEAEEESSESE